MARTERHQEYSCTAPRRAIRKRFIKREVSHGPAVTGHELSHSRDGSLAVACHQSQHSDLFSINLPLSRESRHRGVRPTRGSGSEQPFAFDECTLATTAPPLVIGETMKPARYSKIVADSGCQIRSESPRDRDTRMRAHSMPSHVLGPCFRSTCSTGALKPSMRVDRSNARMRPRSGAHTALQRFSTEVWHISWPHALTNGDAGRVIGDS
jgi:hypothetical protein